MNECKIEKICEGQCSECGRDKNGVRFSIPSARGAALLCWEHFRLLQETLEPRRVAREIVRIVEEYPCCCRHRRCDCPGAYCHRHGRTTCQSRTETVGVSESRTESVSRGRSSGTSETGGRGTRSTHGTTTICSSQGEFLP